MKILIITFLFLICNLSVFAGDIFVYISLKADNKVAILKLDTTDGSLQLIEKFTVSGGPAPMATDISQKHMYIVQGISKAISSYSLDQVTGKLTFLNSIPAVDEPVNLALDKTAKVLFSTSYNANIAAIYGINSNGSLKSPSIRTFDTGINPHAMKTSQSNQYVYISVKTGNKIQCYKFNEVTGDIDPNSLSEYVAPPNTGPRHFVFHPSKPLVYFSNELGSSTSVFSINQTTGALTHLQTLSTLPAGYTSVNTVADIHLTPNNHFLYVSNRGHNSIAAFNINSNTGLMTSIKQYATVQTPRAFNIDPTGKYLIAAGQTSGNLAAYKINQITGELALTKPYMAIGNSPEWVLILDYNKILTSEQSDNAKIKSTFSFRPNPLCAESKFIFEISNAQNVNLTIYDNSGTIVKVITDKYVSIGNHCSIWNGTDNKGSTVPPGIYLGILTDENSKKAVKVIVE